MRCGAGRLFRKGPTLARGVGAVLLKGQQITELLTTLKVCSACRAVESPRRGSLPGLTLRWPWAFVVCGSWFVALALLLFLLSEDLSPGGRQLFPPMASFRARGQIDFRDRSLRGNRDWETHPRAEIGLTCAPARPAERANRRENVRRRSWALRGLTPRNAKSNAGVPGRCWRT